MMRWRMQQKFCVSRTKSKFRLLILNTREPRFLFLRCEKELSATLDDGVLMAGSLVKIYPRGSS